jgi:hypothetical protein
MTPEQTTRLKFAVAQMLVGLIAPLLYMNSLTNFSFATASFGALGYWLILPFVCFLLLAGLALLLA